MALNDNLTPQQWFDTLGGARNCVKDLRADLCNLDAEFRIVFRFFLEPLWARLAGLEQSIEDLRDGATKKKVADVDEELREREKKSWLFDSIYPQGISLERVKCLYALRTLLEHGGNKSRAAKALGVNVKSIRTMIQRWRGLYGVEIEDELARIDAAAERYRESQTFRGPTPKAACG